MKALVTGATGFIGSHLVEELISRGCEVTCLVRKTSELKWIDGLKTDIIYGDCEEEDSLSYIPQDSEYVFHLAGLTKARKDEDFFCVNVKGTENLLKAVSKKSADLKRFVYLSSLAAAGPGRDGRPVNETSEPMPVSRYGVSKLKGEEAVWRFNDTIPVTIIRPPAVYGPRDRDFYVLFKMIKKGFYPYFGKCYYSIIYVDDLVKGIISAALSKEAENGIYFLSDGRIYSNSDITDEITNALNTRALKIRIPISVMKVLAEVSNRLGRNVTIINRDKLREISNCYWVCDSSSAEKEFGFIPKVSIKEGIKWTADWYRIHQWL